MKRTWDKALAAAAALALTGCMSVGQVGLLTKPSSDPGAVLRNATPFTELGPAKGRACRYFVLAVIPFGDSTMSQAINNALAESGGDAILNATVSSSLYGFIPIYNVFSFTCTTVEGVAIRYTDSKAAAPAPAAPAPAS